MLTKYYDSIEDKHYVKDEQDKIIGQMLPKELNYANLIVCYDENGREKLYYHANKDIRIGNKETDINKLLNDSIDQEKYVDNRYGFMIEKTDEYNDDYLFTIYSYDFLREWGRPIKEFPDFSVKSEKFSEQFSTFCKINITPIRIFNNKVYDIPKCEKLINGEITVGQWINGYAYMWSGCNEESIGYYGKKYNTRNSNDKLHLESGKSFDKIFDGLTLHTYAFHGFFKPTLREVFERVYDKIDFTKYNKLYITTEPFDEKDINRMCVGDHHIGITKIFA